MERAIPKLLSNTCGVLPPTGSQAAERKRKLSMDRRVPRLDRWEARSLKQLAESGGYFLCVLPLCDEQIPKMVRWFIRCKEGIREDQLTPEAESVAPGVKCHVAWPVWKAARRRYSNSTANIWSNCKHKHAIRVICVVSEWNCRCSH